MQNKIHIVTSGCSFTSNFRPNIDDRFGEQYWKKDPEEIYTWFHWLWKIYGKKVDAEFHNYGAITNDNKTICRSIFYKVNDLIYNKSVDPKNIIVIAQWTSLTRNSWFISNKIYDNNNNCNINFIKKNDSPPHTNDFINFNDKDTPYQYGYYYLTGGYFSETHNPDKIDEFAIKYFEKVLSKEERYIDWFDSILGLTSYLENVGVTKFHSFQMSNNFSKSYLEGLSVAPAYEIEKDMKKVDVYEYIINQKRICNTWNDINLNEENPYVKMYSDRIDFKKYFWFFEEKDLHQNGGMIEWSIRNFNKNEQNTLPNVLWREMNGMDEDDQRKYLNRDWYGHTSSLLAKKFVEEVILNWDIFK